MNIVIRAVPVVALGLVMSILASCASNPGARLTAAMPREEGFRKELKKELSTLNVEIEMSAAELAETMNRVFPKELYKSSGGSGPTTVVNRAGAIAVTVADNSFYLTIPVSMSLIYGIFETPAIRNNFRFRVTPKVTEEWKLETQVYYTGLSDSLAEEVRIGPMSIKPRGIFDRMTQPLQRTLSDLATMKLNEKLPLRSQVAEAWGEAQKPLQLDKSYNAWLVMAPREVVLYPLYAQNNRLKVSVGLASLTEVVVGSQPPARTPLPLPRLKLATGSDRTFRVAVNTDLYYTELVNIASPLLLNKELQVNGRTVIIKNLELYGNGDRLMVKVDVTGTVDGTFYLTCRPVFSPTTNVLSVQDVDFDIDSRNLLLHSADWLLHGWFQRMIQEKLNVDLTQRLAQAREMTAKSMARVKLADNLFFSGKVKEMRLNDVMVQKDKVSVAVYLEGESTIAFH